MADVRRLSEQRLADDSEVISSTKLPHVDPA